ncbi:MAG: hypothetical protein J3Q66DRAFT_399960 [Benniella sp.]|nr:MAG: hypothetical protein J3Q66DRAFT_399960 [Benniella sp.]
MPSTIISRRHMWMLTGNVRDPDMEAQMTFIFQRRRLNWRTKPSDSLIINEAMRLGLEGAKAEGPPAWTVQLRILENYSRQRPGIRAEGPSVR